MFKKTARFLPILTVFCASVGGIMTQTRSIYGGLFLVFLGLLGLVKGKARSFILIFTCVAMLGVGYSVAKMSGVDILYRFREGRLAGQAYVGTRSTEFQSLIDSIERAPLGLFTGQGFGVLHHPEAARNWRGYFHNDYYGTIFSLGIIGLIIFIYIISSSIIRGHSYRKIPEVAFVTMPPRLIMFSVAGMAVFNQQFWIYKGCGLLMLILAIASNVHNYSGQISAEKSLEEDNYLL